MGVCLLFSKKEADWLCGLFNKRITPSERQAFPDFF
jgi:hypothetical protein